MPLRPWHLAAVLLIEFDGAPRLPLRIETAFAIDEDIGRLARNGSVVAMIPGDERPILTVARIIEMLIELEILGGAQRQRENYGK